MAKKKPTRNVWEPTEFVTVIGSTEYVLTPQPISRVMEFDALLEEIGGMFDAVGKSFDVYLEEDLIESFETMEEAQDFVDAHDSDSEFEIRPTGIETKDFLAKLTESPYLVLKPLIPDLQLEDIQAAPVPQIEYVIGLLVDINGMKWFEGMVKNFLEPLLPTVIQATAGALKAGLPSSTDNKEKD
jgi:hypothetical protein